MVLRILGPTVWYRKGPNITIGIGVTISGPHLKIRVGRIFCCTVSCDGTIRLINCMDKKIFQRKWYYRLLKVLFWGSYTVFSIALIFLGIFESDVEIAGFFWAAVLGFFYWFAKKVFYYVLFGDHIRFSK